MKRLLFSAALVAAVGLGTVAAFSQANEDDVAAAQAKYPLAAKAGEDSHAIDKAPASATNPYNPGNIWAHPAIQLAVYE